MHKAFEGKIKIKIEMDLDLLFDILDSYKDDISTVKNALEHEWVVVLPKEESGFVGISGYDSRDDCLADLSLDMSERGDRAGYSVYHDGKQTEIVCDAQVGED